MSGTDPRRRIPRTDVVLADDRLAEAGERLGAATVKEAVREAQMRARRAEIEPDDVDRSRAGVVAGHRVGPSPGAQRNRRHSAHESRPGGVVGGGGDRDRRGIRIRRRGVRPCHRCAGTPRPVDAERVAGRGSGGGGRAGRQQRCRRARAGRDGSCRAVGKSSSAGASWSRSATGSASPI